VRAGCSVLMPASTSCTCLPGGGPARRPPGRTGADDVRRAGLVHRIHQGRQAAPLAVSTACQASRTCLRSGISCRVTRPATGTARPQSAEIIQAQHRDQRRPRRSQAKRGSPGRHVLAGSPPSSASCRGRNRQMGQMVRAPT
jgi:hypothetical protein